MKVFTIKITFFKTKKSNVSKKWYDLVWDQSQSNQNYKQKVYEINLI